MQQRVAQRLAGLRPFLAMEVLERAHALERAGRSILHLEVGEPDLPPPAAAVEACVRALRDGDTRYTDSRGTHELREAIALDLSRRTGASVDAQRVLVTMGTSPAMWLTFAALIDPGDEVVIGTPHYPCYPNFVRLCGGVPVLVETRAEERYRLDPERVAAALSPRTRAIVVSSPANPTGAVQSRETLEALAALGPTLVSDEIYDGVVYGDVRTTSVLSLGAAGGAAFVLDGFSKRYAMTGFRLGFVVAPEWALRGMQSMQQSLFISASPFVQRAGLAALREGAPHVERMRTLYAARRDRLVAGLRALGFGIAHPPDGAFYALADARSVPGLGPLAHDSLALAFALLDEAGVGVAPGIDFGEAAEGCLRFSHAVPEPLIDEALERIAGALPRLAAGARAPVAS